MTPARLLRCLALALALAACSSPPRLRVLSYNVHHGEGADGRIDLERIAAVIREVDPDVVALQEVDVGTGRSGGVDQPGELARLTGRVAYFGPTMAYDGGEYGVALLLTKHPLGVINHPLPASPDREPKTVLAATLALWGGGPEVVVATTHWDTLPGGADRGLQALAVNDLLVGFDGRPAIVAGGLNAEPGSEALDAVLEVWQDGARRASEPTWPASAPKRRLDYVLYRPAWLWRVSEARVLDGGGASDHRPVLVELVWEGPGPWGYDSGFVVGARYGGHFEGGGGGGIGPGGGGASTITRSPQPTTLAPAGRRR